MGFGVWDVFTTYESSVFAEAVALAAGLFGLIATGTLLGSSRVPQSSPEFGIFACRNCFQDEPCTYMRSLLALTAQMVHITGAWLLLSRFHPEAKWRNPVFILVGLFFMNMTGSVFGYSMMDPKLLSNNENLLGHYFWFGGRIIERTTDFGLQTETF